MYKIMFIDDDKLILRKLTHILEWESLGFLVMDSAADGLQALQTINTDPPDVIITDINMPNMDGLQLVESVKKNHPQIQFIMLTVNDSFGCAQQALNMGVCHYLLKPIEKEKLDSLIQKLLMILEHSYEQDLYLSGLKTKAVISEKMIRDKFLNWIVSGRQSLSENQIIEKFNFYHIPVNTSHFEIISIHINQFEELIKNENSVENLLTTVLKCAENLLCNYDNCFVFSDPYYNINILLGSDQSFRSLEQNAGLISQALHTTLLYELNLAVTIIYSRKYKGYQNIYRCYYETKYLAKYNSSIMEKEILSFDEFITTAADAKIDFDSIRSQILKYLRNDSFESLARYIHQSLDSLAQYNQNIQMFNILRVDHIMTGIMFMQENKAELREVFNRHFDPLMEIMEKNDSSDCISFICEFYKEILIYLKKNKISSGSRLAEKCMEIIDQDLSNPLLCVRWLADQLYINENYLSRQFHQKTGIPLIKYIGNKRLDTAKAYMYEGYSNLQSVAKLVGFSDPLYFSKCFKKRFGVAPSKFLVTISQDKESSIMKFL